MKCTGKNCPLEFGKVEKCTVHNCEHRTKPTNFDKITESVESLAEFLAPRIICADCPYWENRNCVASLPCEEALKEWLQKECE